METRALLKLLTHKRDQIRDKLFSTFLHFILQKIRTFHDQDGLFLVTYVVLQMQIKNYVAYYHVSFDNLILSYPGIFIQRIIYI